MKQIIGVSSLLCALCVSSASAQWRPTSGPGNGPAIASLTLHDGKLFAGLQSIVDQSVFVSTDGGNFWAPVSSPLGTTGRYNSASVFSYHSKLFAYSSCRLIRWNDDGGTWEDANFGISGAVTCFTSNANSMFVGTSLDTSWSWPATGSVYRSTDDGSSWQKVNRGLPNAQVLSIFSTPNVTIATTDSGTFRTTDNGERWQGGVTLPSSRVTQVIGIGPTLFAVSRDSSVFRSIDSGASWQAFKIASGAANGFAFDGQTIYFYGAGIYRSNDNGVTWANVNASFTAIVTCLAAHGAELHAATDRGLFHSTDDGVTWSKSITGLPTAGVSSMLLDGPNLFGASGDSLYRTTDGGAHWINDPSDLKKLGIISASQHSLFGINRSFVQSPDGQPWTLIDTGYPSTYDRPMKGPPYALLAIGDTIIAGVEYGACRTTNRGVTWLDANEGLPVTGVGPFLRVGGDILVAVNAGFYRSSDRGRSWHESDAGIYPYQEMYFYYLVQGQHNIFAGTGYSDTYGGDSVFISKDNGYTWSPLTVNLPGFLTFGTGVFSIGRGQLFVNSNLGLLHSSDDGVTWGNVNDGLHGNGVTNGVTSLAIVGQNIFAGTDSWGVWRRPLSELGIEATVKANAISAGELRISPNPANESATIFFSSSEVGHTEISIVNLLGVEVARVFAGELDASELTFTWHADKMQPGMYECVVRMNGKTQTVPIVVE